MNKNSKITLTKYPTKEEILKETPQLIPEEILILKDWKKKYFNLQWKKAKSIEKINTITMLLKEIIKSRNKSKAKIKFWELENCYNPNTETIHLNFLNISIISALHELGHHLFGESELEACKYSIWLWKLVFPKQYEQMKWEGHMLKKQH